MQPYSPFQSPFVANTPHASPFQRMFPTQEGRALQFGQQNSQATEENDEIERISHYFREHTLLLEYKLLAKHHIPGVYVVPSLSNPHMWEGVMMIHSGLYAGAVYRFYLIIPTNFPNLGPSFRFSSDVYHPMVSPRGDLAISQQFKVWRPFVDYLWHVILYAKQLFYQLGKEMTQQQLAQALNQEAAQLFLQHPEAFQQKVQASVQKSMEPSQLYNQEAIFPRQSPQNTLCFTPWDDDIHPEILKEFQSDHNHDDM